MSRYLLDTNVLSALIRESDPKIGDRIRKIGPTAICTSIVVAAELRYGAVRRASRLLHRTIERVLSEVEVVPFETPADIAYAEIRTELERAGTPIGANDLLIAAQARALGLIVVTDNEREFGRVTGLQVENWLR